ncbi:MAG: DUF3100 domain-containing protein, partial [Spirochaetia bacterium]|nr:DUF3100 domain-containing protein [Spirochaetia bacterium]
MSLLNGGDMTEKEILTWSGRSSKFLKVLGVVLAIVVVSELIGMVKFAVGPGTVVLLPMLYAVISGMLITPDVLGKKISAVKKLIGNDEIEIAGV